MTFIPLTMDEAEQIGSQLYCNYVGQHDFPYGKKSLHGYDHWYWLAIDCHKQKDFTPIIKADEEECAHIVYRNWSKRRPWRDTPYFEKWFEDVWPSLKEGY